MGRIQILGSKAFLITKSYRIKILRNSSIFSLLHARHRSEGGKVTINIETKGLVSAVYAGRRGLQPFSTNILRETRSGGETSCRAAKGHGIASSTYLNYCSTRTLGAFINSCSKPADGYKANFNGGVIVVSRTLNLLICQAHYEEREGKVSWNVTRV